MIITPYRSTGRLTSEEFIFNQVNFATRNKREFLRFIERKMEAIKVFMYVEIPCMVKFVFSCTVIHNFVNLKEDTHLDDKFAEEDYLQPPK